MPGLEEKRDGPRWSFKEPPHPQPPPPALVEKKKEY